MLELNTFKPKEDGRDSSHYICDDGGDYDGDGGSDDDSDEDDDSDVCGDRSQLFDHDKFDGT